MSKPGMAVTVHEGDNCDEAQGGCVMGFCTERLPPAHTAGEAR